MFRASASSDLQPNKIGRIIATTPPRFCSVPLDNQALILQAGSIDSLSLNSSVAAATFVYVRRSRRFHSRPRLSASLTVELATRFSFEI